MATPLHAADGTPTLFAPFWRHVNAVTSIAADMSTFLRQYLTVAIFGGAAVVLVVLMLGLGGLLRPKRPQPQKYIAYESGVDPVGTGWSQSQIRYYLYAFLYVVFAVDTVYLFPWATVVARFGWPTLAEMGVFLGIIALGLLHAARRGALRWN